MPHARLIEINTPTIIVGKSENGIDFNAMDGAPVQLIFLLLTPKRDQGAQLQILADIARIFTNPDARKEAFNAHDYDSFIDAIKLAHKLTNVSPISYLTRSNYMQRIFVLGSVIR